MISESEKLDFEALCRTAAAEGLSGESIGTMGEKRMHRVFKRLVCRDEGCHEVRISRDGEALASPEGKKSPPSGKGGYIADVCDGNEIFEIQTGGFYPLKQKLKFYLEKTNFTVTVVHPLTAVKWTVWVDPETGDTTARRRSPKREEKYTMLPEIFWLSELLGHERLYFRFPVIEAEEYRLLDGYGESRKKRSTKYERMPISLIDDETFSACDVVRSCLPDALPERFTSAEFGKLTRLKGRRLSLALKLLLESGIATREKEGRAYVYYLRPSPGVECKEKGRIF